MPDQDGLTPQDREFQAALKSLTPESSQVDFISIAFEAGRRLGARAIRFWQGTTALAVLIGTVISIGSMRPPERFAAHPVQQKPADAQLASFPSNWSEFYIDRASIGAAREVPGKSNPAHWGNWMMPDRAGSGPFGQPYSLRLASNLSDSGNADDQVGQPAIIGRRLDYTYPAF